MKKRLMIASGLALTMSAAALVAAEAQQVGERPVQLAQAPAAPPAGASPTFDAVRQRGYVQCGTNTGLAGFAQPNAQGVWQGLDVDVCRAVAAAMFGP